MAQKDQQLIFQRAPYVDLVVGPGQLHQMPDADRENRMSGEGRQLEVSLGRTRGQRRRRSGAAMRASTRCVTPRCGPHPFRPTSAFRSAATSSAPTASCRWSGARNRDARRSRLSGGPHAGRPRLSEITLLGQTVNSYQSPRRRATALRLADLLYRLHEIEGLQRIKFVTNYPKDMTESTAAGRARSAEVLALLARARPKRFESTSCGG